MIKEKIVAQDMNAALREVKERYGSEAYILESRTIRERIPGTMNTRKQVELTVSLQPPLTLRTDAGAPLLPDYSGRGFGELPSVEAEIRRIERIVEEIEERELAAAGGKAGYPLLDLLREYGLFDETLDALIREFEDEVPQVEHGNEALAIERIQKRLRCVSKTRIRDLSGVHALLGPAGSGKSSLALKLAAHAASSGAKVVVLGYAPRHGGEVRRLEEASRYLGFEVALAEDANTLLGALRHLQSRDLMLLDMPPLEQGHWDVLTQVESGLRSEPIFRHMVLAADGGWRKMRDQVASADFLALTRADQDDALRPALDLLDHGSFNLGFISSGPDPDSPLDLANPVELMAPLMSRMTRHLAAGA